VRPSRNALSEIFGEESGIEHVIRREALSANVGLNLTTITWNHYEITGHEGFASRIPRLRRKILLLSGEKSSKHLVSIHLFLTRNELVDS
jgi:hypothetical protein